MQLQMSALLVVLLVRTGEFIRGVSLLLLQVTVAVHEAVNTTCCIYELALTGVEWVRGA